MKKRLTLNYWMDDGGYVGRLQECPTLLCQGATLEELEKNAREAYSLYMEESRLLQARKITTRKLIFEL